MSNQKIVPETLEANGHTLDLIFLRESLCAWDLQQRRVFLWRLTRNPFHIMMAELMQRWTQAKQVVGIYNTFVAKYPDAAVLAALLCAPFNPHCARCRLVACCVTG